MRFLDRVDISGSMNLGSVAKDQFIIGTPNLENNSGSVDELAVWANADFKNNVIIGSSPNDKLAINATISGSIGNVTASNLYLQNGTIYLNGQDILANMGGGGGNQGGGNQQGNNVAYYQYILITSNNFSIDANGSYEIVYTDSTSINSNITIYLPDASSNGVVNRKYTFKQINNSSYFTVIYPSNGQTLEGSNSFIVIGGPSSTDNTVTLHAMMDTRDNSYKWFKIGK